MNGLHRAVWPAVGAAILFGGSTPFAKQLIGENSPFLLAGLLYLGSGLGLTLIRLLRDKGWKSDDLPRGEWLWLLGAIGFGGVLGPLLLMFGLAHTTAANASLLLNLEAVLTAVLAWLVFRENANRRIMFGMLLIVAGAVLLTGSGGSASVGVGALALLGACFAWAIDNNLTRKVSASDALFIAGCKGLVAGVVNTSLGLALGGVLPSTTTVSLALLTGFFGYGLSLVLFVLALRELGTARTGAYFSIAPFVGAALSILVFGEVTTLTFWCASALMAAGVWLHLSEVHVHQHDHIEQFHAHRHRHDAHHQHDHAFVWNGEEPHAHPHVHAVLRHGHAHFPDVHHRHTH